MESAVRWHERAVSGKLAEYAKHLALERCVLRAGNHYQGGIVLPAGLSAVLQDRPTVGSGVPVGFRMTTASADGEQRSWIDETLPKSSTSAGFAHALESRVPSKAWRKAAAPNERGVVSSSTAIIAGKEQGDTEAPEALGVVQRSMSKAIPTDKSPLHSAAPASVTADRLPAVLSGWKPSSFSSGRAKDLLGLNTRLPNTDLEFLGLPEAVTNKQRDTSVVSRVHDDQDRYVLPLRAAIAARRSTSGPLSAGHDMAPPSGFDRPVDRILNGPLGATPAAVDLVLARVGEGVNDSQLRNAATDGQNVVPRRSSLPIQQTTVTKPTGVGRRTEAEAVLDPFRAPPNSSSATRRPGGPASMPAANPGMMVALRGDVMMDGRKMGRIVATGQTKAASLPTVSGSAINLRALPIFAGTSAAL